ncbi:MAG: hypothetical protein CMA60_00295 [Euryarchaeota archaeon]|nr:hypothetical protein [Euryarchaeota archaeon]|tara:strand:+ start:11327 stop:11650 length:324 start_codon:yes stop_codon:yes gene_type:complete
MKMIHTVELMLQNALRGQLEKKRVWVKPGMQPFQIHINEETIMVLGRILALDDKGASAEMLNSVLSEIEYQGTVCELIWARPWDKSYGKVRVMTHSRGLCLTIFRKI